MAVPYIPIRPCLWGLKVLLRMWDIWPLLLYMCLGITHNKIVCKSMVYAYMHHTCIRWKNIVLHTKILNVEGIGKQNPT